MSEICYPGAELELFQHAIRWKSYWSSRLVPYLHGDVLEVGAGIGSNTQLLLARSTPKSWTCVEPDGDLFRQLQTKCGEHDRIQVRAVHGTITELEASVRYDAILYIDVLEHIEKDKEEITQASALLNESGYLIVLAPALPQLYSSFDAAIGHYRRYTKDSLLQLQPPTCRLVQVEYLDSFGMLTSFANRYFLQRAVPTYSNILLWDRVFVPLSMVLDKLLLKKIGKSILTVWRRHLL